MLRRQASVRYTDGVSGIAPDAANGLEWIELSQQSRRVITVHYLKPLRSLKRLGFRRAGEYHQLGLQGAKHKKYKGVEDYHYTYTKGQNYDVGKRVNQDRLTCGKLSLIVLSKHQLDGTNKYTIAILDLGSSNLVTV